jgi:CspA family cold shock protein
MLTSVRETLKGIVKRWIKSTGYGFIEPEEGGEDILVHHSDIGGLYELREGQKVEFEVDKTRARSRAINVKIIG